MYLDHFGLNEPPFRITPHTDFFFQGANRGATLEALIYAILHDEGIVKVSGEVGSGKTMLCRVLIERLPKTVEIVFLANPSLSRAEMLIAIADELKLEVAEERAPRLLRELQEQLIKAYAEGRRVVVLIDEAHAMPRETLEEIRLLSNLETDRHKLLQIVLFGQPELDEQLNTADMRQLKERITHNFHLEPLHRQDTESYLDFRMRAAGYRGPNVFSPAAIRLISQASAGLTRRINILADKALLAAFATGSHAVGDREARRAMADSHFYRPVPAYRKHAVAACALAAGLAIGLSLHLLLRPGSDNPATTVAPVAARPAPTEAAQVLRVAVAPAPAPPVEKTVGLPSATSAPPTRADGVAPTAALPAKTPASASTPAPAVPSAAASSAAETSRMEMPGAKDRSRPVPPSRGRLAREHFSAGQDWMQKVPGSHHAIQLMTVASGDVARLEDFLLKASRVVPSEGLFVYSVQINGKQHYRAAYGDYGDVQQTLAAMKALPPLLKTQSPYHRSFERMRSQNRQ